MNFECCRPGGPCRHLANGIVLLIPDPVAGFTAAGNPEPGAIGKLRQLLPLNDQCVPMDDPLTKILDQIQAGNLDDATVRYFSSRVRAGEPPRRSDRQGSGHGPAVVCGV